MSKKSSPQKVTLSEDHVLEFWNIVKGLIEPFGIDKIKEVHHYVQLVGEAVDRHQTQVSPSPKYRKQMERKKFIAIFKSRYLQITDLEYPREINGVDIKLIGQAIDAIQERGLGIDDYFKWAFEVFFPDNPKFMPPNPRQLCSQFMLEQFYYENRERISRLNKEEVRKKEVMDLVARARILIRGASNKADRDKVKDILKAYKYDENVGLVELRKKIEEMEQ